MPWKNQGGGPGGGGSGPWGSRGSGGPQPPNLEDILRESQDRFRSFLPGGGGLRNVLIVLLIAVAAWLFSGIYRVNTDEQGLVLRFGEWVRTTQPGLHYHLPSPIETVFTPKVTTVNRIEVGFRSPRQGRKPTTIRQVSEEGLMLTGDENIVDINFTVFWRIKDAGKFLFNIRNPESTIKSVAESAMRDTTGQMPIEQILAKRRGAVAGDTKRLLQEVLDEYGTGVEITEIQLQKVDPPEQVIDAFRDVQRAKADQERLRNNAEAYRNDIIPRARGEAAQIVQQAEAYKREVVARAEGDGQRFLAVHKAYSKAKDVTTKRIYLETLQEVFSNINKVLIDSSERNASGVVPYLPLPELQKRRAVPAKEAVEGGGE